MMRAAAIDEPWRAMEPVRLGTVPTRMPEPHAYLLVTEDGEPRLRVDSYDSVSDRSCADGTWHRWLLAVGWYAVHLVDVDSRASVRVDLPFYPAAFLATPERLLVGHGEGVVAVAPDGRVAWRSPPLAYDGVRELRLDGPCIRGSARGGPDAPWRPFAIELATGQRVGSPLPSPMDDDSAILPQRPWLLPALTAVCAGLLLWSFLGAADKGVWAFELLPLTAVMLVFLVRSRWFRFSDLSYALLTWFFLIQSLGGRYTFAEVPFPQALTELLGLERNPVDRIGHFFQGFVPAVLLREWLLRRRAIPAGWTLFWLVTGCCLAFSAMYELLEMWTVVLFYPDAGPEWLGMQGDPWDAQWDMTMALSGAVLAQLALGRVHDRSIARLRG